ncbi:hypothetical protein [Acinetobacter baumannii]|uniref:Uncharacterized protein n=1 Tax=Acinetobacter baumannii TaxID=470 RepID=A0A2C9X1P1_ACIBA|nr:hypothetical protein [Acinetobacter baumannii]OTM81800.1 hypothetical protein B9X95_16220 [Acinetobacter baumannii]
MDKKALQEQFEAIAIQNCWNINKYPAGWDGHGDDEYADDFVSGAWWGFQHQQAKVEELQTLYTQQGINMLKLQKRVDALEKTEFKLAQVKAILQNNPKLLESILVKKIEQALKGEG